MPASGVQGAKRKRSESIDPEETYLRRSSLSPPPQLSSPHHQSPVLEQPPAPLSTSLLEPGLTPPSTVLPLTRANLSLLDPAMESKSSSGSKQARDAISIATSENVVTMLDILERHHYYLANEDVETQNQDFISIAAARVSEDRNSPMGPDQKRWVKESYALAHKRNEATFLATFWKDLITRTRTVKEWENSPRTPKEWVADGVFGNYDQEFLKDCVDDIKSNNSNERLLLDAMPKVKTPKPDVVYGLLPEGWCSKEETDAILRFARYSMPSYKLVAPWFLVEGKSYSGNMEEGEVQAMRGGAALNASFRRLDREAGTVFQGDGPGARSMVYSLVFGPMYARINIHWAHLQAGEVAAYYTHRLMWYTMANQDAWEAVRSAVHNILDWGAKERKAMVKKMLEAIVEKGRQAVAEGKSGKSVGSGSRASKKQKTDDGGAAASSTGSRGK
ncbi:MAG: hypothetical protein Q9195_000564 [Heterodermia aff. obscurata]